MNDWNALTTADDLYALIENSTDKPQIIFKDSITCGISAYAKERLIKGYAQIGEKAVFHYLDLLNFRPVSNLVAELFGVRHQSPQIIIVKDRECVYTSSHHTIDPSKIAAQL